MIDWVQAGSATDKSSSLAADAERKESTEDAGESGYWLEVMNDSMTCLGNPSFPKGSFILVRPNVEPVSGGFYVVELPEAGGKTFKQYVEDAGMRYLRSLNPDFRSITIDDSCRFIGRVVDVKMTVL